VSKKRRGRGEGSIFKRNDGIWAGSVSLGFDSEGKRIRKDVYGKTKKEVQEKIIALQQDALNGVPVKKEKITIDQHFQDWLRAKKSSIAYTTHSNYLSVYNNHIKPNLGGVKLKDLNYRQINVLYEKLEEKGLGKRMLNFVSFLLRSALDDAVKKNLVDNNQAKLSAKQGRKSKEARFLNKEELQAFIQAAKGERLEEGFLLAIHSH